MLCGNLKLSRHKIFRIPSTKNFPLTIQSIRNDLSFAGQHASSGDLLSVRISPVPICSKPLRSIEKFLLLTMTLRSIKATHIKLQQGGMTAVVMRTLLLWILTRKSKVMTPITTPSLR